jgi:hypothetical protein
MATSDLIQYLGTGSGVSTGHRRTVETFLTGEAVTLGDALSLKLDATADGDKSLVVMKADTDAVGTMGFIGIALETQATVGGKVKVCIAGICDANVDGACVAGSHLQIGATGGRLNVVAALTITDNATTGVAISLYPIVGIACEADSSNIATIFVRRQF